MQRNMRHWGIVSLIIVAVSLFVSSIQAEEETIKWRVIRSITKAEFVKVGDVKGHIIGIAARRGSANFENGEYATTTAKSTFDSTNGNGTHQGYALYKFEDGSTYVTKFQGTHKATEGGKVAYEGTFEYVSGTGRFEGIKGGGTFTGKQYLPIKEGGGTISDIISTYTLPSK